MSSVRERYGEAFWRAHHEAWLQSELNQREYCEAYGIPLKAFGNWRARFKAEPQPPARKVLYRRGVLSHALSHSLSHGLSHDLRVPGPIVPPARDGRRRRFNVTRNPTAEWVARQITEAFPWDDAPKYLIRDRDRIYGTIVTRRLRAMGIRDKPQLLRRPW
jgi:hypothetical protein